MFPSKPSRWDAATAFWDFLGRPARPETSRADQAAGGRTHARFFSRPPQQIAPPRLATSFGPRHSADCETVAAVTSRGDAGAGDAEEEPLTGGFVNKVVRVGSTVRRTTGPWTPGVHALLRHLEAAGFAEDFRPTGQFSYEGHREAFRNDQKSLRTALQRYTTECDVDDVDGGTSGGLGARRSAWLSNWRPGRCQSGRLQIQLAAVAAVLLAVRQPRLLLPWLPFGTGSYTKGQPLRQCQCRSRADGDYN
jgi:hypothetical protein